MSALLVSDRRRRICRSDDECDAHTSWRHVMTRYQRAGQAKKVKRQTNRRERREGREEIRRGVA